VLASLALHAGAHADVAMQLGLRVLGVFYTQHVQPVPPDTVSMAWGIPVLRKPRDLHQALTSLVPASSLKNHPLMLVCTKFQTEQAQEHAERSGASVLGWVKAVSDAVTDLGQALSLLTTNTIDTGTHDTSNYCSTQGMCAIRPVPLEA
jgi:hypothetical protein